MTRGLFSFIFSVFFSAISLAQYTVSDVITGLKYPVTFEITSDGNYYVAQKGGDGFATNIDAQIKKFDNTGALLGVLWDFTDSVETYFERGVLGVAVDPDFATNNFVYVFYNHASPAQIRVVRFTEVNHVGTNPTIIFSYNDPFSAGNHTGGNIHFKPGDNQHLFITIGDRATQANAQLLTNPCGKYLRINKDGSIPTDNPFYDDGNPLSGNDDRIWTYGHRNSFDFCFSPINDSLYASENGLNTWDEVNVIHEGDNYGWPTCEGYYLQNSTTNLCNNSNYTDPIDDWSAPVPSVTGIMVYDHPLMPEFQGHLLVVTYNNTSKLYDMTLSGPGLDQVTNRVTVTLPTSINGMTDIAQGLEGCIYVIKGGYTANGSIKKICPSNMGLVDLSEKANFVMSPNPAADMVRLEFEEALTNSSIELIDLTGRVVYTETVSGKTISINLNSVSPGIYLVSTAAGVRRLVVE